MLFKWVDGYRISTRVDEGQVVVSANKEGLLSLANHLVTLAEDGGHFHLDEHNSLEEGSVELVVELVDGSDGC